MTTAAQIAVARPGSKRFTHLSYSAISLFQQCPLRFFFRYIAGLPEQTIASSMVLGRALHASLEFHYEQLLMGQEPPALDTLLDVFQETWRLHDSTRIRFGKAEDINTIGRLAERMLRTFRVSALARPNGTILAIEEEFRANVVPGCPELLGRIDLAVETRDALEVTDFKTSRSQWSMNRVDDAAAQLLLYSELVKPLSDGKPLRLAFGVITKTKVPALHMHPVVHSQARVQRTKRIVERIWRAIQTAHFYPVPSAMNCSTCPYRKPCRSWSG